MVKEIVDCIVDAEKTAEEMIAAAREEAKNTLFEAQNAADNMREASRADNKQTAKALAVKAEKEADIKAAEVYSKGKSEADEAAEKYRRNLGKASDFVVGRCMDGWQ